MDVNTLTAFTANLPIDWILIGVFVLLFSFDVLRNGAGRVSALSLALPVALLLKSSLSNAAFIGELVSRLSTPVMEAMIFLVLFAALYFLLRRMDSSYGGEYGQPLQAILAGCATTAILLFVWLQVPALGALWQLGDGVTAIFGTQYGFWWLIGSYATLAFARG